MGKQMLRDEIREIMHGCKTVGDWRAAAITIANKAEELDETLFSMEAMIEKVYGEKALNEMLTAIQMFKRSTPEEQVEEDKKELAEYGYTKGDMISIEYEHAIERFQFGQPVHILMPDNTSRTPESIEDIRNHNGYFGITEKEMDDQIHELLDVLDERA